MQTLCFFHRGTKPQGRYFTGTGGIQALGNGSSKVCGTEGVDVNPVVRKRLDFQGSLPSYVLGKAHNQRLNGTMACPRHQGFTGQCRLPVAVGHPAARCNSDCFCVPSPSPPRWSPGLLIFKWPNVKLHTLQISGIISPLFKHFFCFYKLCTSRISV